MDSFLIQKHVIKNMLENCKGDIKVELLVQKNFVGDSKDVDSFFEQITKDENLQHVVSVFVNEEVTFNHSLAYNKLLKESKGDFICIFDNSSIVKKSWLQELILCSNILEKTGSVSIPFFTKQREYAPVLDKSNEFINVWKSKDDSASGVCIFSKGILNTENCFDESEESGFLKSFSLKIKKEGWNNIFTPSLAVSVK